MIQQNIGGDTSESPFFTVLIPTMNRPKLLESALASVLWQTFQDFEVIISDNSNSEESVRRNRQTVDSNSADPRVRYVQPASWMNMPDHWEFASRQSAGRYVLILTDRFVMRPSALASIRAQLATLNDELELMVWDANSHYLSSGEVHSNPNSGIIDIASSHQFLIEFVRFDRWETSPLWVSRMPRILNCCYRRDVAERIRKQHGRLHFPMCPDYTAGYLLLAYTAQVAYFDCPLYISHGGESSGQRGLIYGPESYLSSLGDEDWFSRTPTSLETVTNAIVRDFLMVKDIVGDTLADVRMDLVGYFMCNYVELLHMERLGSQRDLDALYRLWWNGVKALSNAEQARIDSYLQTIKQRRSRFISLRRRIVRFRLEWCYHLLVGGLRQLRHRLEGKPSYATVLAAAKDTDYLTRSEY